MFKGHPKGLYVLFFSNMGERFAFYTMLAIFTLFLQDHYGWCETDASALYGYFLAATFFAPMLGGIIADAGVGYGKTVAAGIVATGAGYLLLSQSSNPEHDTALLYTSLGIISLGIGLFKGNLAVILGNLYENPAISHLRDAAFNIFYMGINIGSMFAPYTAKYLKNLMMENAGYIYDSAIPKIANDVISGVSNPNTAKLQNLATQNGVDLMTYAQGYIEALSKGYNWGFATAGISMIISIIIFLGFRKYYSEADYLHKNRVAEGVVVELTPRQTRDRIVALLLVFLSVVFFWLAFFQQASTLTFFAKNYTDLHADKFTFLLFSVPNLLAIFSVILGITVIFNKQSKLKSKIIGGVFAAGGSGFLAYTLNRSTGGTIAPELFQSFNPIFVVFLTPVIVGYFAYLNKHKKEPSTPGKIGFGMIITALAFAIMLYASIGLPSVRELGGNAVEQSSAVSPYWLIVTYFTLTVAELLLSPMGLSFVSKISPPKLRGTMQAGWLGAIAAGGYLAGFVGRFYENWELWQFFALLIVVAAVSAVIIFMIMGILKRTSESYEASMVR